MSDNSIAAERVPVRAPLVSQTAAAIRARIQAGKWQLGDQLPSEPQLASELGISRGTLRESVRVLISNGLLDRRHGVGTFVARVPPPSIDRGIDELFGAGDAIAQLGYRPTMGACRVELIAAPFTVAVELRLARPAQVCHIERVRLADGRPVMLCDDYVDPRLLRSRVSGWTRWSSRSRRGVGRCTPGWSTTSGVRSTPLWRASSRWWRLPRRQRCWMCAGGAAVAAAADAFWP